MAGRRRRGKAVSLEDVWPSVAEGVGRLITASSEGMDSKEFMVLYSNIYNYCTTTRPTHARAGISVTGANFVGEELYRRFVEFLRAHMSSLFQEASACQQQASFLQFYQEAWARYTSALPALNHLFSYLNRHWIKREAEDGKKEVYPIKVLGLVVWRDDFFSLVKERLSRGLLNLIEQERNGDDVPRELIRSIIDSYVRLGLDREKPGEHTLNVYKEDFEAEFLEATTLYYAQESQLYLSENHVSDYMKRVMVRLSAEKQRVYSYLHASTEPLVIKVCEREFIDRVSGTLQAEFDGLLMNDKVEDMGRMFDLMGRIPYGLDPLKISLERYIQAQGEQRVESYASSGKASASVYVETLLAVWSKFSNLVKDAFKNDVGFVASLDKACRRFMNDNAINHKRTVCRTSENLVRHCNQLLKKGCKEDDETIETILDNIMVIFKYIDQKDVFLAYYSRMLSKRLIEGKSASEDLEHSMLQRLKATCGFEYTSKLQRMFQDMTLSKEMMDEFLPTVDLPMEVNVMVLANGSWPLAPPSCEFSLPPVLQPVCDAFSRYYGLRHSGRKLTWMPHLSKCLVRASYFAKPRLFQCTTYQLGVLQQFETHETRDFADLQVATQLDTQELQKTMWTLVKTKVIKMTPKPTSKTRFVVPVTASFQLLTKLKTKLRRVNIAVRAHVELPVNRGNLDGQIEEDRLLAIQAAIVRIMKSRKALQHTPLIAEVVKQLSTRFPPRINAIKRAIDILIEREYLERNERDRTLYEYIA